MDGKNDWRPGPTVCRCCLSEGCYKDISTEYFWMGKKEVYADMLLDTFELTIQYAQTGGPNSQSRLICEPCISRLRDAADFKRQVKECEQTFLHYLNPSTSINVEVPLEPLEKEPVKIETVKQETALSDDDDFGDNAEYVDDDDDLDDEPLMNLATKVPKKESVDVMDLIDNNAKAEKRKASTKSKASPAKKAKVKEAKPTASKPKPEKKKKETSDKEKSLINAKEVLQFSTLYPFRLRRSSLCCVYCHEEFLLPREFREHVDEYHETFTVSTAFAHCGKGKEYLKVDCTNLKCRFCKTPYNSIEGVAKHLRDVHECKIDLNYEIKLQPYNLSNGEYFCAFCDEKFPSLTKLCRHTTRHYLKYTCDTCGRGYMTIETLRYHIRCSHSGKLKCRKCWAEFATEEARKRHYQESKACWCYCCTTCGERFKSWNFKQKHSFEVHGKPTVSYNCTKCDILFQNRKRFYAHHRLKHSDNICVCTCCGLKFDTKKRMEEHALSHSGEKKFSCSLCNKVFARMKGLNQHMWIHNESKRFSCMVCEKKFSQKVNWIGHMRSHHPEVSF